MKPSARSVSCVLRCTFPSDLAEIDVFCREVRERLVEMGLSAEVFPVEMLLRESLNNAVIHGNCGDVQKKVGVEICIGRNHIMLRVEDEGDGFDWKNTGTATPDPGCVAGRGLSIYVLYARRTSFNGKGNHVALVREIKKGTSL